MFFYQKKVFLTIGGEKLHNMMQLFLLQRIYIPFPCSDFSFYVREFMFQALKRTFQTLKRTFQDLKHIFQALERRFDYGITIFSS